MAYTLRDNKGTMKAKFANQAAETIMAQGRGFFRDATYKVGGRKLVVRLFEINEDSTLQVNESLVLYLWEGDVLAPDH